MVIAKTIRNNRIYILRDEGKSFREIADLLPIEGFEVISAERVRQLFDERKAENNV